MFVTVFAFGACHAGSSSLRDAPSASDPDAPYGPDGPNANAGDPSSSGPSSGGSTSPSSSGSDPSNGGPGSSSPPDPGPPRVRFFGRFDTRSPAGPVCAWPGCRIAATFDGSSVSVRLDETVESWMQGGPSEWDVTIDGRLMPKLVLAVGMHDYVLAHDLAPGRHTIELYKRSEAQNGYTQFLGYDFAGGTLLPPPLPAGRQIEIVGDSQPAGFGVDGVGTTCPGVIWAAKYENFHESFGAVLGEILHADVQGTVYSGKGFAKNIYVTDTETMPIIYDRANPIDPRSTFDLSTLVPDAIVLMMGGNDFALRQPADDGAPSLATFTAAYEGFVANLRASYPSAHLFLVASPSVTDEEPAGRSSRTNLLAAMNATAADRAAAGDARVYVFEPPLATPDELLGCNGHGTPQFHRRIAEQIAAFMRPRVGWQ
jgi:hypothetical protein